MRLSFVARWLSWCRAIRYPCGGLAFDPTSHHGAPLGIRAFLLATSPGQRARFMLPTGFESGIAFPVTSK